MNHAERYIELVVRTRGKTLDASYHAAFYLLSSEQWIFDTAKHHVSSNGIDFEGLKQCIGSFDEISQNMIEIAYNLFKWTSHCKVTPFAISRMGYPYIEQVCNAIYIASGEIKVQIQHLENGVFEIFSDYEEREQ